MQRRLGHINEATQDLGAQKTRKANEVLLPALVEPQSRRSQRREAQRGDCNRGPEAVARIFAPAANDSNERVCVTVSL